MKDFTLRFADEKNNAKQEQVSIPITQLLFVLVGDIFS